LADRTPVPAHPVDGEHVIRVLHRFQIEQQRREAEHAERDGGEDRALQTVGGALAEHTARRPCGAGPKKRHPIERTLDADWTAKGAERAQLALRKARCDWRTRHGAWSVRGWDGSPPDQNTSSRSPNSNWYVVSSSSSVATRPFLARISSKVASQMA